jgi:hypothetical protein
MYVRFVPDETFCTVFWNYIKVHLKILDVHSFEVLKLCAIHCEKTCLNVVQVDLVNGNAIHCEERWKTNNGLVLK